MAEVIIADEVLDKPEVKEVKELAPKDEYTPEQTKAYVKKLRTENEKLRKDSDKKLEQEREAKKTALEEQGKFKELYETTLKEAEAEKLKVADIRKENALRLHLIEAEANNPELLDSLFKTDGKFNFEVENGKIVGWEDIINPIKEKYSPQFGTTKKVGYDPKKGLE